jgi:hypothetical protein
MNARPRNPVRRALAALFVGALAAVAVVPAGTAAAKPGHDEPLDQIYLNLELENVTITSYTLSYPID